MMKKKRYLLIGGILLAALQAGAQQGSRPLKPADYYKMPTLASPDLSPDGKWVAYSVSKPDTAKDRSSSDIFMTSWDGKETLQLTHTTEGESQPKFSPDNQFLAFVSSRPPAQGSEMWLLNRKGGEARKLTDLKGDLMGYEWSPDGKKLLLEIRDTLPKGKKTARPIVIDRYRFKQDVEGYVQNRPTHLYVLEIATKKLDTLTRGIYSESGALWSPDGRLIAFSSNRTEDPDRNSNADIFVIEARPNAEMRRLTTWGGRDNNPVFSPDGKSIAYLRSTSDANYIMYDQPVLAVVPVTGGEPRLLTLSLDRPVSAPEWARDGKSIYFLKSDDRRRSVNVVNLSSGKISTLQDGERSFQLVKPHPNGGLLLTLSTPEHPAELFTAEKNKLQRITWHQAEWLKDIALAKAEGFESISKDGTKVSGILYTPKTAKERLPLILFIHGGPVSQDEFSFDLTRQTLSAAGYAVAAVNYRGSNGRGIDFSKAIYADWGNKEVDDLLGAVDHLVKNGVADPNRLAIGGWSYGGILTNYTIARDSRFKAAISGAGSALQLSLYGVDQYILQLDNELGAPWKNLDKYLKLSYPFLHADRIKTPTLFMTGEKDFNVPAVGSEQMYQALRSQDLPTQLIIYPGQFHGLTVPSYNVDRLQRYIAWYDQYLKKEASVSTR